MKLTLKKWGNSLAIRIPKQVSDNLMLLEDSNVTAYVEGKKFILEADDKEQQLAKLLSKVKKQDSLEWGESRGKEFW
jgi:antitoxin MazE